MATYLLSNYKGGAGKTTSAGLLAAALAARGRRVLGVDADRQGSFLRWAELVDLPYEVTAMPVTNLHTTVPRLIRHGGWDDVVIDSPPLEPESGQSGVVLSAMRLADYVVVTFAPTTIELDRLPPTLAAWRDVEPLRRDPGRLVVLLNRCVANAASPAIARARAVELGAHVLAVQIPRLEFYAQAHGGPPDPGLYHAVLDEIERMSA